MPGIVGLLTKLPRHRAEPKLRRMVETLRHESFYTSSTWIDAELGIYIGLTAHAGSYCDRLPLQDGRGEVLLFFSGEHFEELETPNGGSQGASCLVDAYKKDDRFPATLNGRFHGLLVDRRNRTATLFNDRYGSHQVYFYETKDAFYFAAEAKAILAVQPATRSVDPAALGELVSAGCVLDGRSLFRGLQLLPPASKWVYQGGAIKTEGRYFRASEWEQQDPLDGESYYQELRAIFSRRLPRYFEGQQPIAMSLTGGLDTRMIMAWQNYPPGSLPCYTFGGSFRDCRDVLVAREVARVCQQPHHVITVGENFLDKFSSYAERAIYLTDGCTDVSRSVALYANEQAREIAPTRMAGVYGSEILRRLRGFKPAEPPPGIFHSDLLASVRSAKKRYGSLLELHPVSFSAFSPTPQRAVDMLEQTQLDVRLPFLDNEIVRTAFRSPSTSTTSRGSVDNDVCLRLIDDGNSALRRIRTDRGLGGRSGKIRSTLSRTWQEFTFKSEYAYDYGMPQLLARIDHVARALRPERLFLGRHKFAHFRVWYRDQLSSYVKEMLLDPHTLARPYLDRRGVARVVENHLKGSRNHTLEIHRLLSLELLHRLFVDAAPAGTRSAQELAVSYEK